MKLICIGNESGNSVKDRFPLIPIRQTVTVASEVYWDNTLHYRLVEYPTTNDGRDAAWWAKNFIPLSSIDETTFERNYNKEPA